MGISLIIQRWLATIITFFVVLSSFILIILCLHFNTKLLILMLVILGMFWAFSALPLRNLLITTAKRNFVRGWYDTNKLLEKIVKETDEFYRQHTMRNNV